MTNQKISEIKQDYYNHYKSIRPSPYIANSVNEIWSKWNNLGISSPDIDAIATNFVNQNDAFFQEVVQIASKVSGKELQIAYCPFILNDYNLCALSAKDGYLVIVDEIFLVMLHTFANILMYEANGFIKKDEFNHYAQLLRELVIDYFCKDSSVLTGKIWRNAESKLFERDYEAAELAVYLLNSFKIFMFAHEISHHILGHTTGTLTKLFLLDGRSSEIKVDKREFAQEFEADRYGYKIFLEVLNTIEEPYTPDGSMNYTYCKYRFEYAPLFLFDIFAKIDMLKEKRDGTHPLPMDRKKNLLEQYQISDLYYYDNLKDSLNSILKIGN